MSRPYFDLHHTVAIDEIDAQQHVHNLRYLQWTLWAARDHSAAEGWDAATALENGFGWVVRGHDITYRAAALAGDEVIVRTWIPNWNRYSCQRHYMVTRPADQTVLARVQTRWVFVDLKQHRAVEIPSAAVNAITLCETSPPLPWKDDDA
ncbi:acyl-CoA thioesterase [Rhodopirellula sp. JC740]|uniref:Acyl-CoA thioesterase n=1 Tax=Rhodopirellula halodulae TaxID=2894198 RepID=A0ABS8NGM8_9BACT|nr:acyl-CoA thioesterase [Rhodopirellula sp. JC740]MCC9642696.1 acyl-CoA thioesterase [Rhodopirellula sp. JC740]